MAHSDRIDDIGDLEPAWLAGALRAGGALGDDVDVDAVSVEQIAEGVGIASLLYRVTPTYRGGVGPTSLVVKLPTRAADTRAVVDAFDFYLKECRFYADLAASTPVTTPETYHVDVDVDSGDFVIVMEDLAEVRVADQLVGCTPEDAATAIDTLADVHARWWASNAIDDLDWLPRPQDPPYPQALQQQLAASWPRVVAKHGDLIPPEVLAVATTFNDRIPELMARLSAGPTTLVHGDYRLDNLLFGGDGSAAGELTVIDWQICMQGKGSYDTGYFMSQSIRPDQRVDTEQDLLRRYHDRLLEAGVSGYSFEQCWDDYRLGLLFCLVYPASGEAVELVNDRAIELFRCLLERSCRAIVETGALDLL